MKYPSKETVEALRRAYPAGCTVELDDIGTIHVAWSTGSGLGVAFGQDRCRRMGND